jgi:hypothetical protein
MRKSVLVILLGCAMVAGAQVSTQAQTAPQNPPAAGSASGAASTEAAPTIKDPAEYNAYVNAVQQTDPNAKISALEAFLVQYPSSVMKTTGLEVLMGTYQAVNNPAKMADTAKRLLGVNPCSLQALVLLTYTARQALSTGQNPQQSLADLTLYSNKGLDCVKAATKPAMSSDADWESLKKKVTPIFEGGAGFAAFQNKDYPNAVTHLRAAVQAQPDDPQAVLNVYPLALAYLTPPQRTDDDTVNGLFFLARAVNLTNGNADISKYLEKSYKNYHGSDDGLTDVMTCAKASPLPTADCPKVSKYIPPTPAQQAHTIVDGKTPEQISQLSFGEWELVLSAGAPEDQDKVWSVIKGKPLQMEGNVVEATSNTELHIAASADDIEKKAADITLTMTGPIPVAKMPKPDDVFDFQGVPTSYTPAPFMMMMEDGKLLKKAGAPAPKKPPVRRRPVAHKAAQ